VLILYFGATDTNIHTLQRRHSEHSPVVQPVAASSSELLCTFNRYQFIILNIAIKIALLASKVITLNRSSYLSIVCRQV
jgi:hypothetical protein